MLVCTTYGLSFYLVVKKGCYGFVNLFTLTFERENLFCSASELVVFNWMKQ